MAQNKRPLAKPANILMAVMPQSPFNRSIWSGFVQGFQKLGHRVHIADAARLPAPESLPQPADFLFTVHGFNLPLETLSLYREKGICTAVYLLDEPYEVDRTREWAAHYDHVFSVDEATVPVHAEHTSAHFLPLAYNAAIFGPDGPSIPSRILVLGSPFSAREAYLASLRDQWGDKVTWVGPGWKAFSSAGIHYEQFVPPEDCARFYRGADIAINIHRDSTWSHFGELNKDGIVATHLNPRFWETAACNTLQLCSYRKDLERFAPRCPSFSTVDEFMNKLEYFMQQPRAREDTARRVYNRIRKHNYEDRCKQVLETLGWHAD